VLKLRLSTYAFGGSDMGDSSLIRTTLLLALLAAMGFVAAGRAPAAESAAAVDAAYGTAAISLPPLR
jgi:hypothetical protein